MPQVSPKHQARTGGGRGISVALGGSPNVSWGRRQYRMRTSRGFVCLVAMVLSRPHPMQMPMPMLWGGADLLPGLPAIMVCVLAGRCAPGWRWPLISALAAVEVSAQLAAA
jgi:hypothetical protein